MKPSSYKRLVIKVGSALLVDQPSGMLREEWLKSICADLAVLAKNGTEILVVSSGAIALGRSVLKLPHGPLRLDQSQAAAAIGQVNLASAWSQMLGHHDIQAAQILLTLSDTEERHRYLNARATLSTLLDMKCVPVINENDTVATSEIRYGDNDRLAARVASMVEADGLILLSDIDGMYTANPQLDENAQFMPVIEKITPEIEAMAGGAASEFSRGGMKTKVDAAKIAVASGCDMVIASGKIMNPLAAIDNKGRHTVFKAQQTPLDARKKWIVGAMSPPGKLRVDAGAILALHNGKSLLPSGVVAVEGVFKKGDVLLVLNTDGHEIARGLTEYSDQQARQIIGRKSPEIEAILGSPFREEIIHRNHMVLT